MAIANTNNRPNNHRRNNNNNKTGPRNNWTAYKNHPRSVCITVYDMQGSPISDDVVNRIIAYAEESVKASNLNSLAIAVNRG